MLSFVENNLLSPDLLLSHKGEVIAEYEDMSPTLENLVVLLWLQQLHTGLPAIVKQKYGADLRSKTLASLKPEISLALPSLLEEAKSSDAHVMRSGTSQPFAFNRKRQQQSSQQQSFRPQSTRSQSFRPQQSSRDSSSRSRFRSPPLKVCSLCKAAGRESGHFLSACKFLTESDKRFMTRARQVIVEDDYTSDGNEYRDQGEDDAEEYAEDPIEEVKSSRCSRV